jgi:putative addiction module component (TIGR02574 family)
MGSPTLERLRAEVLNLSEPDRAELAQQLVASLDGTSDPGAQEMWDAEIVKRLAEIDAGTAKLVDREEFRRRLRARINRG